MILALNGHTHTKKKNTRKGGRLGGNGGEEKGRAGRQGNSFANQALVLRSISSCQWVPGVNKVISFNPALQLYITPSSREYTGLFRKVEGEKAICLLLAVRTIHGIQVESLTATYQEHVLPSNCIQISRVQINHRLILVKTL